MGVTCRINYDRRTADAMSHGPISFIRRGAGRRRSSCNFEDCAAAHDDDRQWHRRGDRLPIPPRKPQRQRLTTYRDSCHGRWATNHGESPTWSPGNPTVETWRGRGKKMENRKRRKSNLSTTLLGVRCWSFLVIYTYTHQRNRTPTEQYHKHGEIHDRGASRKLLWVLTKVSASFKSKLGPIQFDIVALCQARRYTHLHVREMGARWASRSLCVSHTKAVSKSDKSLKLWLSSKPR